MEKLTRNKTALFIDIADHTAGEAVEADYARIGKSTIFDLSLNPEIASAHYIEDEFPSDELGSYKPSLPQELALFKGDKAFDYMYKSLIDLPTGEKAKLPVLLVFPVDIGTESAQKYDAWLNDALVSLSNFNTIDAKLTFNISFGGNITRGTVTNTAGKPIFTAK